MARDVLSIGCAAGFGGDRTDAALPIVEPSERPPSVS
jgi:hypothetical protein